MGTRLSVMPALVAGNPRLSFEVKTWMAGTSPAMTKESPRAPLRRRELHQLDRVEVLHAAADALGRVEQDVRLGGERVAQHVHALAVDDEITALEIAERDRERVRTDVRHVLGLDDRERHQRGRAVRLRGRLPEIVALPVLELADRTLRLAVHHEHAVLPVARLHRVDEID